MLLLNYLYLISLAGAPLLLGLVWYGWFTRPVVEKHRSSRRSMFLSGLCAATINLILFWGFAVWLHFHDTPESWRIRNPLSTIGFYLVLFSIVASLAGEGRYRLPLGIAGVLAILPWIPLGVL